MTPAMEGIQLADARRNNRNTPESHMRQRLATTPYPILFVLFALVLAPPAFSGVAPPASSRSSAAGVLSDLPIEAQATISAVLGRDQRAYHAWPEGEAIHLINTRHGLKAVLTAAGVELESAGTRLRLRLRAVGRGAKLEALAPASPKATANRIEYQRTALTEWYVNGPLGLEQGFTFESPPGHATGEVLTLALDLGGELGASPGSEGMTFLHPDGTAAFCYRGLAAWDASGRTLPAWWQQVGKEIRLRVDDTGAAYPLTIDPFFQQAKLTASDGATNDAFGFSVAVSGDKVVVGAPVDTIGANATQGSAYVFVAPPGGFPGALTEIAKLTASDGAANDAFGSSVAVSGDAVVVGAPGDNVDADAFQGSAYVFVAPPGGFAGALTETAKLTASEDGLANDAFGTSVAVSGGTVVVGANGANSFQGSAYVFVTPPGGFAGALTETAKLTASDGLASDAFGTSVAASGGTVVVGANGANSFQGSAYVFVAPPGGFVGALTESARLTASDGLANAAFGASVAVSGDTIAVGAPLAEIGGEADQGAAYVFVAPPGGFVGALTETAKLTAPDGSAEDAFGTSVAISDNTVVVGAPSDTINTNAFQGSAYVIVAPPGGFGARLTGQTKLTASDGSAEDAFGFSVAISGDTLVVGARSGDIGSMTDRGSAYVFLQPSPSPSPARCLRVAATLVGTERADTLLGTPRRDVIAGLGGNDIIQGLGGDDSLCGGPGNDVIIGGGGRDWLMGEGGKDKLQGGPGPDTLKGGPGNDKLDGGTSRDSCKDSPGGHDSMRSCELPPQAAPMWPDQ